MAPTAPRARRCPSHGTAVLRPCHPWSARSLRATSARRKTFLKSLLEAEAVSDTTHRVDQRRVNDIDLVAQVADVRLEHARVSGERVVPHVLENLIARQHASRVRKQVVQQAVLGGRELDELAG